VGNVDNYLTIGEFDNPEDDDNTFVGYFISENIVTMWT
jgi:hypothetical protein